MDDRKAVPVLIGPFPDPVNGMSVINMKLEKEMRARGLAVERIDLSPGMWARGAAYHLKRIARAARGAAAIFTAPSSPPRRYIMSVDAGGGLVYNILLALAIRCKGQKILLYHHSTRYVMSEHSLMRLLLAVTGQGVPHVFCSPKMGALFRARYGGSGDILVINNAAWVRMPGAANRSGDDRLRLGFLSNFWAEKGPKRAIETLRKLRNSGIDAVLVTAGALPDPEARQIVQDAEREFGTDFFYQGILTGEEAGDFYASLDYFLFPSLFRHETQSLVVPEALAMGVPVIAYDHRFVSEVLGEGGLLIPASESFAEGAATWIANADVAIQADRRRKARTQFEKEHALAAGQIDRLVAWVRDTSPTVSGNAPVTV